MVRNKYNLPIHKFLQLAEAGHRRPDPLPLELVAAAILFVISALVAL